MSYSATDTLCRACRREQEIGIVNGVHYRECRECVSTRYEVKRRLGLLGGPGYVVIDTECPGEGGDAVPLGVYRDYEGGREDARIKAEEYAAELNANRD